MNNSANKPSAAPIEEIILIIMVIFCLAGVAVTDFSPEDAFIYWLVMIFVFGFSAIIAGWNNAKRHYDPAGEGNAVKALLKVQFFHWLGSFVSVICLFSFVQAGHLSQEGAGLMVLLILGLTTYLDGIRIGWRFCLTGIYLVTAAVVANFVKSFMVWLFVLAVLIIVMTIWREKRKKLA
jgi:hypothetical protein